jgi:hypothetical protein
MPKYNALADRPANMLAYPDRIGPTPRNEYLGALADFLARSYAPQRTQQMQGMAQLLGVPAVSQTLDRLSYGELLTTGAGMTTRIRPEAVEAALTLAPLYRPAGMVAKGAEQAAMAAGKAGERYAEKVLPGIMERGGLPAQLALDLTQGTRRPLDVFHGTPHKFPPTERNPLGEFDASKIGTGEGAQAYGHGIYMAESQDVGRDYATVLASPRNRVRDKRGVYVEPSPMGDGTWRLGTTSEIGKMRGQTGDATQGLTDYEFKNVAAAVRYAKKKGLLSKDEKPVLNEIASEGAYSPVRSAAQMEDPLYNQLIASDPGYLYKVDLPDAKIATMLDFDTPLSKQPPQMQSKLKSVVDGQMGKGTWDQWIKSEPDYKNLANDLFENKSPEEISQLLRQAGISGIKYLDANSRHAGGTRNFVVFPGEEKSMTILERNRPQR